MTTPHHHNMGLTYKQRLYLETEFRNSGVKLRAMGVESSWERMGIETSKRSLN